MYPMSAYYTHIKYKTTTTYRFALTPAKHSIKIVFESQRVRVYDRTIKIISRITVFGVELYVAGR